MEMEVKQRAWILLSFGVSWFEFGAEEMRFWKRNLGLVSSSRNSISLSDGKVQLFSAEEEEEESHFYWE